MANYRETAATGTAWIRANQVVINNPYEAAPSISFGCEQIVLLGDKVITVPDPRYLVAGYRPVNEIPLLDPATGEPTGEIATHSQLYGILYSLFIKTALEQDAKEAADAAALAALQDVPYAGGTPA